MKRPLILFLSIILSAASITAWSVKDIEGVTIHKTLLMPDKTTLKLNGAGTRVWGYWPLNYKLYVMQLFVESSDTDTKADAIINDDKKMAVTLTVISDWVTKERLIDVLKKGFNKTPDAERATIQTEIDQFYDAFTEDIKLKDKFSIHYTPEKGTVIYKNDGGEPVTTIDTQKLDFKKALCRIWLGKDPVDDDLKNALLKLNINSDNK